MEETTFGSCALPVCREWREADGKCSFRRDRRPGDSTGMLSESGPNGTARSG